MLGQKADVPPRQDKHQGAFDLLGARRADTRAYRLVAFQKAVGVFDAVGIDQILLSHHRGAEQRVVESAVELFGFCEQRAIVECPLCP
ncbi:hypothetical protein D9M71_569490 [compost metagenome]